MQYTVPLESHCGNLGWTAVKYCCWHGRYAFTVARLPIRYCSVSYADSELPPHKFNLFFSWLNISCHSRENQWKRTVPNKQRAQQSTAEQHECIASNSSWGFFFVGYYMNKFTTLWIFHCFESIFSAPAFAAFQSLWRMMKLYCCTQRMAWLEFWWKRI